MQFQTSLRVHRQGCAASVWLCGPLLVSDSMLACLPSCLSCLQGSSDLCGVVPLRELHACHHLLGQPAGSVGPGAGAGPRCAFHLPLPPAAAAACAVRVVCAACDCGCCMWFMCVFAMGPCTQHLAGSPVCPASALLPCVQRRRQRWRQRPTRWRPTTCRRSYCLCTAGRTT